MHATLITNDEEIEVNNYKQNFHIKLLQAKKKPTTSFIYEIETDSVHLKLCNRLKSSQDFSRRLFYRYDWIQPVLNENGEIISVDNTEELNTTWPRLRERILKDYKGVIVNHHLDRISKEFETGKAPNSSLRDYLHFGLLIPEIPAMHNNNWTRTRTIQFSEFDGLHFDEEVVFTGMENDLRCYDINWNLTDDRLIIEEQKGKIKIANGEFFPSSSELYISIKNKNLDKVYLEYKFKLTKINKK